MYMVIQELQENLNKVIKTDPGNTFQQEWMIYDPLLLGAAPAVDPLFYKMKEKTIVGAHHLLPEEWLPGAVTVISYFLPFTKEVRASNEFKGKGSMEWLHARFIGEEFNNKIRSLIVQDIKALGADALAPLLEKRMVIDFHGMTSNWSERHAAYAAGLGTFSLNRGLITAKGMAGRFGSVITTLHIEPTPRSYNDPFQYCPWMVDGSCGACMKRCPSGAITEEGKDKKICHEYLFNTDPLKKERGPFGYPYSACGKCQTGVPCENQIP